jgi:hypothetical protein
MVEEVYKNYPLESLHRIWLTLQHVMNKIIDERGDNKFNIHNMNKEWLERTTQLPPSLVVTPEANKYPLNTLAD